MLPLSYRDEVLQTSKHFFEFPVLSLSQRLPNSAQVRKQTKTPTFLSLILRNILAERYTVGTSYHRYLINLKNDPLGPEIHVHKSVCFNSDVTRTTGYKPLVCQGKRLKTTIVPSVLLRRVQVSPSCICRGPYSFLIGDKKKKFFLWCWFKIKNTVYYNFLTN